MHLHYSCHEVLKGRNIKALGGAKRNPGKSENNAKSCRDETTEVTAIPLACGLAGVSSFQDSWPIWCGSQGYASLDGLCCPVLP
jgi:hypothetical protein